MSADLIRRAVAGLRAKADAAVAVQSWDHPARVNIDRESACDGCGEYTRLVASYPAEDSEPWLCAECAAFTDFALTMHPGVALALADLLDGLLAEYDEIADSIPGTATRHELVARTNINGWNEAVALSRAVLGVDS